jgi:general secretion pathway protein E
MLFNAGLTGQQWTKIMLSVLTKDIDLLWRRPATQTFSNNISMYVLTREDTSRGSFATELIKQKLCSKATLYRAEIHARNTNIRLGDALVKLGLLSEDVRTRVYAEIAGLEIVTDTTFPNEPIASNTLRASFIRANRCIPLTINEHVIVVAFVDPPDAYIISAIELATKRHLVAKMILPVDFETQLEILYSGCDSTVPELRDEVDVDTYASLHKELLESDDDRVGEGDSQEPVIRFLNECITKAVDSGATDVHLEPTRDAFLLRYRYDGVLNAIRTDFIEYQKLISRIKVASGLDIAEKRLPQDGRLKLPVRGIDMDFRVSTVPTMHGEKAVIRILNTESAPIKLDMLNLPPPVLRGWRRLLQLPDGLVLVAGPTGSGKTTTIASSLMEMPREARNIVTAEDPVEYDIPLVNQMQVRASIGLDFASLLRSLLRQDPDVIIIGEIRDKETAVIAMQASLTGHLVLSTVHTNSAAASITRLLDLGVPSYLVEATLRGVLAQRLIRRLCTKCHEKVTHTNFYLPTGCPYCRNTGFKGRFAVAELMQPTEETWQLVRSGASWAEIEKNSVNSGMRKMSWFGNEAVARGLTTWAELRRGGVAPWKFLQTSDSGTGDADELGLEDSIWNISPTTGI